MEDSGRQFNIEDGTLRILLALVIVLVFAVGALASPTFSYLGRYKWSDKIMVPLNKAWDTSATGTTPRFRYGISTWNKPDSAHIVCRRAAASAGAIGTHTYKANSATWPFTGINVDTSLNFAAGDTVYWLNDSVGRLNGGSTVGCLACQLNLYYKTSAAATMFVLNVDADSTIGNRATQRAYDGTGGVYIKVDSIVGTKVRIATAANATFPAVTISGDTAAGLSITSTTGPAMRLLPTTGAGLSIIPTTGPGVRIAPSSAASTDAAVSIATVANAKFPGVLIAGDTSAAVRLTSTTGPTLHLKPTTGIGFSITPSTGTGIDITPSGAGVGFRINGSDTGLVVATSGSGKPAVAFRNTAAAGAAGSNGLYVSSANREAGKFAATSASSPSGHGLSATSASSGGAGFYAENTGGGSGIYTSDGIYAGDGIHVSYISDGSMRALSFAADAITSRELGSTAAKEIRDSLYNYMFVKGVVTGIPTGLTGDTSIYSANLTDVDNYWNGQVITFFYQAAGARKNQSAVITRTKLSTVDSLRFAPKLTTPVAAGDSFYIWIPTRGMYGADALASKDSGMMKGDTAALAGNTAARTWATAIGTKTVTVNAIANDAITAAAIQAGAITSSEAPNLDAAITTRLAPTVASRTLDVTTTGEAGIDWANIGGATSTVNLSGTTISTVTNSVGSISGVTFPANFSSLGITATGQINHVANIDTGGIARNSFLDSAMTRKKFGTDFNTLLAHLDVDVSTRSTYAGGAISGITGVTFPANVANEASVTKVRDSVSTFGTPIAAIKAKTDNLPATPASGLGVDSIRGGTAPVYVKTIPDSVKQAQSKIILGDTTKRVFTGIFAAADTAKRIPFKASAGTDSLRSAVGTPTGMSTLTASDNIGVNFSDISGTLDSTEIGEGTYQQIAKRIMQDTTKRIPMKGGAGTDSVRSAFPPTGGGEVWTTAQKDSVLGLFRSPADTTSLRRMAGVLNDSITGGGGSSNWSDAQRDSLIDRVLKMRDTVNAILDSLQNVSSALRVDTNTTWTTAQRDSVLNRSVKIQDSIIAVLDSLQNLASTLRLAGSDLDTVYQTVLCNDTIGGDFLLTLADYRAQVKRKFGVEISNTTWMTDTVLNQLVREAIVTVNPIMRGYKTTKVMVSRFDSSDYPLDSLVGIGSVVWHKDDTARSIPYLAREKWATLATQNTYGGDDPYLERPQVYDYTDAVISFFPVPTSEDTIQINGWAKIPNITVVSSVAQIPQKYRVAVLKYASFLVARAKQHPLIQTFLDEYHESVAFLMAGNNVQAPSK